MVFMTFSFVYGSWMSPYFLRCGGNSALKYSASVSCTVLCWYRIYSKINYVLAELRLSVWTECDESNRPTSCIKIIVNAIIVYKILFEQPNMATLAQPWGKRFGQDFVFGHQTAGRGHIKTCNCYRNLYKTINCFCDFMCKLSINSTVPLKKKPSR